jgi:hypothetical protein
VRPVTPEISSLRLQRGDEIEPVAGLKDVGVDAVIVVSTDSPIGAPGGQCSTTP